MRRRRSATSAQQQARLDRLAEAHLVGEDRALGERATEAKSAASI
jgi:hypothetical protein